MKMPALALLLVVIAIAITTFDNTGTVDPQSSNLQFYNSTLGQNSTDNYLWDYFANPKGLTNSKLWQDIVAFIFVLGFVGFVVGVLRFTTSDAVAFSPVFTVIFVFGFAPIGMLFSFLQRELSSYMCGTTDACYLPTIIAILFAGSLALNWLFACLQQWRTGFTGS